MISYCRFQERRIKMKCPLCKDKELLPCRLTEASIKPDGLKCPKCGVTWRVIDGKPVNDDEEIPRPIPASSDLKTAVIDADKPVIMDRLVKGDKPAAIAADMGYTLKAIHNFKYPHRKEIESRRKPDKPVSSGKAHIFTSAQSGSVMSAISRMKRGELSMKGSLSTLQRYDALLDYEIVKSKGRTKELKRQKAAVADALKALDIIEQGKKDVIIKIVKFL